MIYLLAGLGLSLVAGLICAAIEHAFPALRSRSIWEEWESLHWDK